MKTTVKNNLKTLSLILCVALVVHLFGLDYVTFAASPNSFKGYNAENIVGDTFAYSGAEKRGTSIAMTDSVLGEAIGYIALDEAGSDISAAIDLGGLEIDFSTTVFVEVEGALGSENDQPTIRIDFCETNYSNVISSVLLAKADNTTSGRELLSSNAPIPVGTRSVMIYLYGQNTVETSENTIVFEDLSFIIRDADSPACDVDYNFAWTNAPVTVTVTASDDDSGLEGICGCIMLR